MQINDVVVLVSYGGVIVRVLMRFRPFPAFVVVLMMLVVHVRMFMLQWCVFVRHINRIVRPP